MRLAIDAMGGDDAPQPIVRGTMEALLDDPELHVILVGDLDQVNDLVEESGFLTKDANPKRLELLHTDEYVGMDCSPSAAMRKPNSSINLCWKLLAEKRVDGLISAGNTGAVVAGGLRSRLFLEGIQRPGIAVAVPSPAGSSVLVDVGANVYPKPEHLLHYGVMGAVLARKMLGVANPRIGLLNVGSEEAKGNDLAKATLTLFQGSPLPGQFIGNVEGRDIFAGTVDVIVCDGFVGNVVLKTCEGLVDFLMGQVVETTMRTLQNEKDLAKQAFRKVMQKFHHSEFGAAPLLGIDGACLICHGGSDAAAIRNAVRFAGKYLPVNEEITRELDALLQPAAVPAS